MLERFAPSYSPNSYHSVVPINSTVDFMTSLKSLMESCGWRVTQTYSGRGALIGGNFPTATPVQPGEIITPSIVHFKQPGGDGRIGTGAHWQYYDPIRQIPDGGAANVIWIPMGIGTDWLSTAGELGAAIAGTIGGTFKGLDTAGLPYGRVYLLFDNGPLGHANIQVFGTGTVGGTFNYTDPYYNIPNTTLAQFAIQGAGWELVSSDGTTFVEITERIDNVNYALPGENPTAPYLRVKAIGADKYQFLYPFSIQSAAIRYHFHVSDKQIVVWLDGITGPTGRPSNIIISSLSIPDDPPAFLASNLYQVLVVIGSTISVDGSYFLGDSTASPAQVRTQLSYARGTAQDFYSYNEGDAYSQSRPGPGPNAFENGQIGFVMRGLDNGRNLLGTNKEPLAQTPWLVAPRQHGQAPSWIVGKLRDAMLLSYAPQPGSEAVIKHGGKYWHLLSSQATGGVDLNGSLWLTAVHDSDVAT